MLLKNNNLNIITKIKKTSDATGLISNDIWCDIYIKIKCEKYTLEFEKKLLTYNEIISTVKYIEEFVKSKAKAKIIKYIKNYMIIKLIDKRGKKMIIKLVRPVENDTKNYNIEFNGEEIREYVYGIKKQVGYSN